MNLSNRFTVPPTTATGDYYIIARFTNATGSPSLDTNASNNTAASTGRLHVNALRVNAPSGLRATNVTTNSATLQWYDNSGNETAFRLEQNINGTWQRVTPDIGRNATSANVTGLSSNTTYTFRLRTVGPGGVLSSPSNPVVFNTKNAVAAPQDPTNVQGYWVGEGTFRISWNYDQPAKDFLLQIRMPDGKGWSWFNFLPGSERQHDLALQPGFPYEFRLQAHTEDGQFSPGGAECELRPAQVMTADPTNVRGTWINNSTFRIEWDNDMPVRDFLLQLRMPDGKDFGWFARISADKRSIDIGGLQKGFPYEWKLHAFGYTSLNSGYSGGVYIAS
jgi:hypothetical protein